MTEKVGRDPLPGESPVRLGFCGFHPSFNPHYNHLSLLLRDYFPIVTCQCPDEVPDFLFFSVYGNAHRDVRYRHATKIFTCEENIRPPWDECHYALTSDREVPSDKIHLHLRLPIYAGYLLHLGDRTGRDLTKKVTRNKTRFCNFVYSNPVPQERRLFFEMLSKYKRVDSAGGVLNNLGVKVKDKISFLEEYKFTIAFENSRHPGYVSEKIVEPMAAGSLPIYWGDRLVGDDFNPRSFVDANEPAGTELRANFEHVVEQIAYLDQHDDAYEAMMTEPWFVGNVPNRYCQPDYLARFMGRVLGCEPQEVPRVRA